MRIVVWNCKMGLSRKRHHLYGLRPDIAVIPECSQICLKLCLQDGFEGRWFGDNPHKGLGVLVAKPLHIRRSAKPRSKWVVPLEITGGPCDFLLIAVWTMLVKGNLARSYIGQLSEAVLNNPQWFAGKRTIVCGDFNSNKIWDDKRDKANHSTVVSALEKHRLASVYHHFFSESQGQETQPTTSTTTKIAPATSTSSSSPNPGPPKSTTSNSAPTRPGTNSATTSPSPST